ncbi:hypothetical protein ABK046_51105, partial [Streptomyces caeruleatus]
RNVDALVVVSGIDDHSGFCVIVCTGASGTECVEHVALRQSVGRKLRLADTDLMTDEEKAHEEKRAVPHVEQEQSASGRFK